MKAVLVDFYGTLAEATEATRGSRDIFADAGYEMADDVRQRWLDDGFDGSEHLEHSVSRDTYLAWQRSRWEGLARACGVGEDDLARLVDDVEALAPTWRAVLRAYPEVPDVLAALRARGVRVVICSNWDWDLDVAVEQVGLAELVDVQVTSARAGARKPNQRIFAAALDAAGCEASEAVFAGDSWRPDIEGPLAAGMRAALHIVRGADDLPQPALPAGAHRASDLRAVLDLV